MLLTISFRSKYYIKTEVSLTKTIQIEMEILSNLWIESNQLLSGTIQPYYRGLRGSNKAKGFDY